MSVQIVLFDGFDPLDVIAPFEVFVAGSEYFLDNALDITLVSAEGARDVVSGSQGLRLRATAALDPHRPGIVLVPGASGPVDGDPDEGAETIPVLWHGSRRPGRSRSSPTRCATPTSWSRQCAAARSR